jgi:hypothetical protein
MIHHFQKLTGKNRCCMYRSNSKSSSATPNGSPPMHAILTPLETPQLHTRPTFPSRSHLRLNRALKQQTKPPPLPGEPPELRLEEALGLLRRERVPHHELPRGRLVPLDSRSRVPLSLHTHGPTRHHGDGPRPRGVEPTRHGRNAREDSVWGKADGGEIGNAGSVAGALSLGREAETGCVRGRAASGEGNGWGRLRICRRMTGPTLPLALGTQCFVRLRFCPLPSSLSPRGSLLKCQPKTAIAEVPAKHDNSFIASP